MTARIKPRFQVEKLKGKQTRKVYRYVPQPRLDPEGNQMVSEDGVKLWGKSKLVVEEVTEPLGYMVYFPKGHSVHIRTEQELRALGFDRSPTLVDLESGEEMEDGTQDLKSYVASKTKPGRGRFSQVEAN